MPDMPITADRTQDDEMRTCLLFSLHPPLPQHIRQQMGPLPYLFRLGSCKSAKVRQVV